MSITNKQRPAMADDTSHTSTTSTKDDGASCVQTQTTHRTTVSAMEELLYQQLPVLDHGFIRVIDYMGDDTAIAQAARISYGTHTKRVHQDQGLINVLMRHNHTSPFEMCEIKLHLKMPIFVARQWLRHRTVSVNEYSARYSILDKEFYIPQHQYIAAQLLQSQSKYRDEIIADNEASRILHILQEDTTQCYEHYCEMLNIDCETGAVLNNNRSSITRETARINLPLSFYTQMYWKVDLHNLLHFLELRSSKHAQFEIREYANKILEILKVWVPHVYEAFVNYRLGSHKLSSQCLQIIKDKLSGKKITIGNYEISTKEWEELMEVFELDE